VIVSDFDVIKLKQSQQDQVQSLDNCYYFLQNSEFTTYLHLLIIVLDFIIWTSIFFCWRLKNFLFPHQKIIFRYGEDNKTFKRIYF